MKFLNIHDYKEPNKNIAYQALIHCNADVLCPQFDYEGMTPSSLFDKICAEFNKNFCDVVVGTGIGGYFALIISAKYLVPTILIDPVIVPGLVLPQMGYTQRHRLWEMRTLERTYLQCIDTRATSTIINTKNTLIDDNLREYTKVFLYNKRYQEISYDTDTSTATAVINIFDQYKEEWWNDYIKTDLAE